MPAAERRPGIGESRLRQGYAYTQTQTQGGGNARVTRVALPWADLLRPFRPVALDSLSNTIPPPRRPTNLVLLGFARIQFRRSLTEFLRIQLHKNQAATDFCRHLFCPMRKLTQFLETVLIHEISAHLILCEIDSSFIPSHQMHEFLFLHQQRPKPKSLILPILLARRV